MVATKRALGLNYVMGTGIVMSALIVPTMVATRGSLPALILGLLGVLAAVGLSSTGYWLGMGQMHDEQIWRVATHAGLGIGLLTLSNLLVIIANGQVTFGSPESTILASSIVFGGTGGALAGIIREYDRSTTTLTQSTEVLSRVLRHNLRNDMTVILGQLDQLEENISGPPAEQVRRIRSKIDEVVTLSEKAQEIEFAVTGNNRQRHPVDAVTFVKRRAQALKSAHTDVAVKTDLPESAWVSADWMLETAIENVFETTLMNGDPGTELKIDVDQSETGWAEITIVDVNNHLPAAEINTLRSGTETPLQHSQGLGLWLVNWIIESYGGTLDIETGSDCSIVKMRLRRTLPAERTS